MLFCKTDENGPHITVQGIAHFVSVALVLLLVLMCCDTAPSHGSEITFTQRYI